MHFLFQPAYVELGTKKILVKNGLIGFFVFFFLFAFEPSGLYYWEDPSKIFYLLGFGIISFLSLSFNDLFLKRLFPKFFHEENWVLWKSLFWMIFQITTISVFNILFIHLTILHTLQEWPSVFKMVYLTFLIGVFPACGALIFFHFRALKKYSGISNNLLKEVFPENDQKISLLDEKNRPALELQSNELIYLETADNYTLVFYKMEPNPMVSKFMIRNTIGHLEKQLPPSKFFRCHRSFLVNLEFVKNTSGNAQGLKLHLKEIGITIPVSRSLTQEALIRLKQMPTIYPLS